MSAPITDRTARWDRRLVVEGGPVLGDHDLTDRNTAGARSSSRTSSVIPLRRPVRDRSACRIQRRQARADLVGNHDEGVQLVRAELIDDGVSGVGDVLRGGEFDQLAAS